MKKLLILVFCVCSAAKSQQSLPPMTLNQIKDLLSTTPPTPAAVIEEEIRKHGGVDFAADDDCYQQLQKLHIQERTWKLIAKVAPAKWEQLRRSPARIHNIAVSGGVVIAAVGTNQLNLSSDHGETWPLWVSVADSKVHIGSIAACGPGFAAAGSNESRVFVYASADGRSWSEVKSWLSDTMYDSEEGGVPVACNGGHIAVRLSDRNTSSDSVMSSEDQGKTWLESFKGKGTRIWSLAFGGGVLNAVMRDLEYMGDRYCSNAGGDDWQCGQMLPSGAAISVARMGPTVCLGRRYAHSIWVSYNQGQAWKAVAFLPETEHDTVHGLLSLGRHVAAATAWEGVLLGDENCENWKPLGVQAPEEIMSLASDDKYLYAGAEDGVYRFKLSAIPK